MRWQISAWPPMGQSSVFSATLQQQVTIDATATSAAQANAVQSLNLNTLTIGPTANALLVFVHFGSSNHAGYAVTWDQGGTNQVTSLIWTCDNGAGAPAIAVHALLNPTLGNKTLNVSFSSAADDIVMYAVSLNNVNTLAGVAGAFAAGVFSAGTSAAPSMTLPAIPGGIQFVVSGGIANAATGWAAGPTSLYVDNVNGSGHTWGAGADQNATAVNTFTLNIGASVAYALGGVVANPPAKFSASPTINFSNSISSGLTACIPCLAAGTLTDLVTSNTATTTAGCTTDVSGGYGGGVNFPSHTERADFGLWQPIPQGDYTIVALVNGSGSGTDTQAVVVGQCDGNTVSAFACLQMNTNDASSGSSGGWAAVNAFNGSTVFGADDNGRASILPIGGTWDANKLSAGTYHAIGGRLSGTAFTTWIDGANSTRNTVNSPTGTWSKSTQHFAVGHLGNYTLSNIGSNTTIILVLVWNRALSDAEMASITANPFQVLR